ncbi:hypothetical protein [Methylobacterium komagatae]
MEYRVGNVTVRIELLPGNGAAAEWQPSLRAWKRAARFVEALGADAALHVMDARAERALVAGRVTSAVAWRELMVAVHRMSREERLNGERDH